MHIEITTNNICIIDGAEVKKEQFPVILHIIRRVYDDCEVLNKRTDFSLKMEWAVHCFLYRLGIKRARTKDVDLDYPCDKAEWLYKLIGCLVWLFIK